MKVEELTKKIKQEVQKEDSGAQVILFGSRARGNPTAESDWDILVLSSKSAVGFKDEQTIRHRLYDIELETGQSISTFVYSLNEWNTRLIHTPFYDSVKRDGIYL